MFLISLLAAAAIVAVDLITKIFAVQYIKPVGSIPAIPHVLNFTYTENRGAAFGMLSNSRWVFILGTIAIIIAMLYFMSKNSFKHWVGNVAAVLVVGGGVGNLVDRITLGYVIDFLDISPLFDYAIFNFADSCVCVGACLLIIYLLFIHDKAEKKQSAVKNTDGEKE